MNAAEIFIKRPVFTTVLSAIIILLGAVTWNRLAVRQYPQIEEPKISIITTFEGAGPEIIEAQITKPLEDALMGIEGLDTIFSRSSAENSAITLTFKLNRNIDAAASDVRDRVARAKAQMPPDAAEPRIKKADAEATAMMFLAMTSDRHHPKDMADYAVRYIQNELEVIVGVSSAEAEGGGVYEMHLTLDPIRLAAYRLTAEDVAVALKKQNVEKPAGRLMTKEREIVVTTTASLLTEKDFNNLILGEREGHLIKLSDVGTAKLNAIDHHFRVTFNGAPALSIPIIKQSTANPLAIAKAVKELLPKLRENLPEGMKIDIAYDGSTFIEKSIDQVYSTIYEAILLVVAVTLFFLHSPRATLIPLVTIPISLIGTFAIMYWLGFSINTLTLLAMVLAVGLVVDDAIVILENIYRNIEEGMEPFAASIKGVKEIGFAVIAMTLTLVAVYAPIALSTGMTGKLFTEFAITLASSVLISGFVALTLSPMMCARLLKPHKQQILEKKATFDMAIIQAQPTFSKKYEALADQTSYAITKFLDTLDEHYGKSLSQALKNPQKVLMAGGSIFAVGLLLLKGFTIYGYGLKPMAEELAPKEDQGFFKIRGLAPQGARVDYIDRYMAQVDEILKKVPEIQNRLLPSQAPGESVAWVTLAPWEKRKRSNREVIEELARPLDDVAGIQARAYPSTPSLISSSAYPFEMMLETNKSLEELGEVAQLFWQEAYKSTNIFEEFRAELGDETKDFAVKVDREKAAALGVDVSSIGETIDTMISGRAASQFKRENKKYNIRVELEDQYRRTPDDITGLFMRGIKGKQESMVPLAELIKIVPKISLLEIVHFDGQRAVQLLSKIKEPYGLDGALKEAERISSQVLPEGFHLEPSGATKKFLEESANTALILGLALVFIYMVLAAQYESFVDPLIILVSVPLSLVGGVIALKLTGGTINLFSKIGFVTLIGLISKHGILIVDFANQNRLKGMDKLTSVIEASKVRLRPILMTTFAMVLGALPLAISSGAGAESRSQIGWVIVGGMSVGTLFTLYVVPTVYTYLSRRKDIEVTGA